MTAVDSNTTDNSCNAAVIVAHPDDEVLWCGGLMLMHPDWHWTVVTLCRASDPDRAPRFDRVMQRLGAQGVMGDLDDGPDQTPLDEAHVRRVVQELLPTGPFDLVLTHGPRGEYTRHRRHEECCRAVVALWRLGKILTSQMWLFAYEDKARTALPQACTDSDRRLTLTHPVWGKKQDLIVKDYGFDVDSWEARTTPTEEGYRCFESAELASEWVLTHGVTQ